MNAEQPLEARCDHCKQTRPLFLYEPDHNCHLVPRDCEWCDRDKQPLLCVRCWDQEREREENQPPTAEELALTEFFVGMSARTNRSTPEADR
ncbi:hypothetical protein [Streptomyces sp. NPDC046161]|uniref:hypothetical protein n=1 Tax=Streptomyces sp. NPDC046161 TaxID=3155132 RepID=UPI003402989B